jgi:ABC-2 type transport system ATP-binding protein
MTTSVAVQHLNVHFEDTRAVDDVTFSIPGGTICGLLGRNGAGKTTLLSALAAFREPTSGEIRIGGLDPYEHPLAVADICLVREGGDFIGSMKVDAALELVGDLRPAWDRAYADRLVDRFELPRRKKVDALSRGMRSALAVSVGLASRASLTMFDEPHLGMDAAARYAFYDELLADYLAHPRTIILSTHLIDEVASILEEVVIIDHGRLLLHEPVEELQGRGAEIIGAAAAVEAFTRDLTVVSDRTLGPTRSVTTTDRLTPEQRRAAADAGLELGPIHLQDLFVQLTSREAVQ